MVIFEQQDDFPKLLVCNDYKVTKKKDSKDPKDIQDHEHRFSETIYAIRKTDKVTTFDLRFLYPSTSQDPDVPPADGECCVPITPAPYVTVLKLLKVSLEVP